VTSATRVAIALGSNLGDRDAELRWAGAALAAFIERLTLSSFVETAPVGVVEPQPQYLNAAATGFTALEPRPLLDVLLSLEQARGRTRTTPNAPRTLDLDLILYGDAILDEPGLVVPHPRFRERMFVLAPLAEIASDLVDPVTGLTVHELSVRVGR
jgi:2-amino-4-hydroxy-6-hydroxymethyldihydropteridine diphosphokinase